MLMQKCRGSLPIKEPLYGGRVKEGRRIGRQASSKGEEFAIVVARRSMKIFLFWTAWAIS